MLNYLKIVFLFLQEELQGILETVSNTLQNFKFPR